MSLVLLTPLAQAAAQNQILVANNPPMQYDVTLGDPNAQGIIPPYPTQAAHIDDKNGNGSAYAWNITQQKWL